VADHVPDALVEPKRVRVQPALGLAVAATVPDVDGGGLASAYRPAMIAAAALAGLSALTAALTIRARTQVRD